MLSFNIHIALYCSVVLVHATLALSFRNVFDMEVIFEMDFRLFDTYLLLS